MSELIDEKNSYEPHKRIVIKTGEDRYQSVLVSDISFAFEQWNNRIEELNRVRELADHFINCFDDCDCKHCLEWPTAIIKALDGEQ